MRINDAYRDIPQATSATATRPSPEAAPHATESLSPGAAPATVTVSDKARELSSQTNEASDAKVQALRGALADGTFKVNTQVIAQRIVEGD